MSWNNTVNEPGSEWGGAWTEKKLNAFSKYVKSYLIIMKKYPYWKTIYFDGFAGSGERKETKKNELFKQLSITQEESSYKGAAERVLEIGGGLGFDYYYFIEKDKKSLKKLETRLSNKFTDKTLVFRDGDANFQLDKLAQSMQSKEYAALVLLDPFGMQID